jgi:hypothetical protein
MILKIDNTYVEVKKYEPKREGRGGAMGAVCKQVNRTFLSSVDRIRGPGFFKNWSSEAWCSTAD